MLRPDVLRVIAEPPAPSAWSALRDEVRRFVARRVPVADVEDVVQEVLVAIAGSESPRPQRLGAFAYGVARRVVADHHRARAREHARLARLAVEPDDDGGEPLSAPETALAGALALFLADVSPLYAEAVRAVDVDGGKQSDVARALGVPLSTLRTRVQRGRDELRGLVRRCCEIELDARGRVVACEPRGGGECGAEHQGRALPSSSARRFERSHACSSGQPSGSAR